MNILEPSKHDLSEGDIATLKGIVRRWENGHPVNASGINLDCLDLTCERCSVRYGGWPDYPLCVILMGTHNSKRVEIRFEENRRGEWSISRTYRYPDLVDEATAMRLAGDVVGAHLAEEYPDLSPRKRREQYQEDNARPTNNKQFAGQMGWLDGIRRSAAAKD